MSRSAAERPRDPAPQGGPRRENPGDRPRENPGGPPREDTGDRPRENPGGPPREDTGDRPRENPVDPPRGVPPALEIERLAFAYPDGRQALFGISARIEPGERVALLGPNGAGKTTLVLHLNGILGAVAGGTGAGRLSVGGLPVTRENLTEIRRRVGIVFQDPDDQLFLPTVRDDVAFGPANLGLRGAALNAAVERALAQVGMSDAADRPPHHLSYGQRRRVAVATVLAMEPQILVLDEPSSNLDPAARRELADILTGLDVTILMVTHDLPYALQLCPRSLLLDDGRLVEDGPTRDLLSDAGLMARHRLELPYGFDPLSVPGAPPTR